MADYSTIAKEARKKVLQMIYEAQTSHIGSNYSAIDIMAVLFSRADMEKDEVILSAGWKAAAWYYFLWKKGVITEDELNSFCQEGSPFIGLVEPMNRWGLRFAGGSMGYGLPFGVGVALAKKLKGEEGKVYVLMSDGELQCGTTWESVLIANKNKLRNLVVIVDDNGFQAMGETKEILPVYFPKIPQKNVNGHDYYEIEKALDDNEAIIIAHTTKGKGVSFMENNNLYHYKQLSQEEYDKAYTELNN